MWVVTSQEEAISVFANGSRLFAKLLSVFTAQTLNWQFSICGFTEEDAQTLKKP